MPVFMNLYLPSLSLLFMPKYLQFYAPSDCSFLPSFKTHTFALCRFYDYSCSIFLASLPSLLLPYFFTIFVPSFWHYCMFHVLLPLPSNCPLTALSVPSYCPLCPPCALFLPTLCPSFALFVPSFCHSCMFHVLLPLPSLCPHLFLFCI